MNDEVISLLERCQIALFSVVNCVDAEMPIDDNNAIVESIRELEQDVNALLTREENRRN